MPAIARRANRPCPCGRENRHGHCCGDAASGDPPGGGIRPDWLALKKAAMDFHECGRLDEAEALYRKVLELRPAEFEALHQLGAICYRTRRPLEAFSLFRQALDSGAWPGEKMLGSISPILDAVFVGKTFGQAARLRASYDGWKSGQVSSAPGHKPLVSVVLPVSGHDCDLGATLASVCRQTYGHVEIIVAVGEREPVPQALLESCPFPCRVIALPDSRLFALLNHGVRHAAGEFISILMPGDKFDCRRIEKMVGAVVHAGGKWGFSGYDLDPASVQTELSYNWRAREIAALLESIRGCDTTGFALLEYLDLLALHSNLFFCRSLFDAIGGFAEHPEAQFKDFALRALLQAEPIFHDEALVNYRIAKPTSAKTSADHEWTQIAWQGYLAKAVADAPPANPYAPVLPVWGDHFIARLSVAGRLHLLSKEGIRKCLERAADRVANLAATGLQKHPGLDLVSMFGAEIGLAESARGIAVSCRTCGIPFTARTVELPLRQMRGDRSMDPWLEDSCHRSAVVIHVNPDSLANVLSQLTAAEIANRYLIGFWYWETERIPEQWRYALDFLDEFWVATGFVADAMRKFTAKPVVKIRPPIDVPPALSYTRADFGLEEGRFLFLFAFDFGSYSARKNPYAAIHAFKAAFPPGRDDVGLVIKSHGGAQQPEKLHELHAAIQGDPRIRLIDRRMSRNQMFGLQSVCDAFVSLHRAEGLGLGLAESMALGKAVIGTAYSGNLEFMNENNSCLVDCKPVPIRPGDYLYDQPGVMWADPDMDHAAFHMRRLVEDGDYYRRLAAAGKEEIRQRWNFRTTGDAIRRRLLELGLLEDR
jgi:glycosyltransferase involved in cell wall biosynthesis